MVSYTRLTWLAMLLTFTSCQDLGVEKRLFVCTGSADCLEGFVCLPDESRDSQTLCTRGSRADFGVCETDAWCQTLTEPAECVLAECRAGRCIAAPSALNDVYHCGVCENACEAGGDCVDRACTCAPGRDRCSDGCTDTNEDRNHCGECGVQCPSDKVCASGSCRCPTGKTECDGVCRDLAADEANCGGCGVACQVDGQTCQGGDCSCPDGAVVCEGACNSPGVPCENECLDPLTTGCDLNATCVDIPDGFECRCPDGWFGDGTTCVPEPAGMIVIPAGDFLMGCGPFGTLDDSICNGQGQTDYDAAPEHTVFLDEFYIDELEVTVASYTECVRRGPCPPGRDPHITADPLHYNWDFPGREQHPMNGLLQTDAATYCSWAGKRLPTEAEWEKAARGVDGQIYPMPWDTSPWSQGTPTCGNGNFGGCNDGTVPVASYPGITSPFGALDMLGNVAEWVSDRCCREYGTESVANPVGTAGSTFLARGSSWIGNELTTQAAYRRAVVQSSSPPTIGFRCAVTRDELLSRCEGVNCGTTGSCDALTGSCVFRCDNDDGECPPSDPYCNDTICGECSEDAHCDELETCDGNTCVPRPCGPPCSSMPCGSQGCGDCGRCDQGFECRAEACQPLQCAANRLGPCPAGQWCIGEPGTYRCLANPPCDGGLDCCLPGVEQDLEEGRWCCIDNQCQTDPGDLCIPVDILQCVWDGEDG